MRLKAHPVGASVSLLAFAVACSPAAPRQPRDADVGFVADATASVTPVVAEAGGGPVMLDDARIDQSAGAGGDENLKPSADCSQPPAASQCASGLCRISAGCFIMGARRDEVYRGAEADIQVQVRLSRDFWLVEAPCNNYPLSAAQQIRRDP